MEHWALFFQIAVVIFFAGGAVAALHHVCSEVHELKDQVHILDQREAYRHQHTLVVLTMLASYHNPNNDHLTTAIENLARNNFSEN